MSKLIALLIVSILSLQMVFTQKYPEDESVLVLGDTNIAEAIKEFKYILVEFYAPWCGHCKTLAPEYAAAAKQLSESGSEIKLAKVDATENPKAAAQYKVSGYPTLYYFVNGLKFTYSGPRDKAGIVDWVIKKSQPPSKELTNIRQVEEFISSSDEDYVIVFMGNIGLEAYLSKANSIENVVFGHCQATECLEYYKAKNGSIVMFKNFENKRSDLAPGFGMLELQNFLNREGTPLVITYEKKYEDLIKKNRVPGLFFFYDQDSDSKDEIESIAKSVAPKIKNKLQVVLCGTSSEAEKKLAEYVSFPGSTFPYIRINDARVKSKTYKFESTLNTSNILKFVDDYYFNRINPEKKSEPVPAEQGPVFKLVGFNFNEVVMDPTKDVFIKFYSPNCGHCVAVAPIWEEFAKKIQESGNSNVIIADIDVSKNEFGFEIASYPLFFMYPATKEKIKLNYDKTGERTVEKFTEWLVANAKNKIIIKNDL